MKHSHGGWRPGAGRPNLSGKANHMKRPRIRGLSQLYLKFVLAPDIKSLKRKKTLRFIERALVKSYRFRWTVHSLGVTKNQGKCELHILCQSSNNQNLSQAIQSFTIRLAKLLNTQLNRNGSVFWGRYQLEILQGRQNFRRIRNKLEQSLKHAIAQISKRETIQSKRNGASQSALDLLASFLKIKRLAKE